MKSKEKLHKPKARTPRGFEDRFSDRIRAERAIIENVSRVYELYGFEPIETSALEYADALGKFLPDQDRPNEGVFSFQDDDDQWLALRYDLTAPLARHVAQNYDALPKPYKRYEFGPVWRNEKPGPGRFRQFVQCDADIIGSDLPEADAEICMLAHEGLQAAGLSPDSYIIRVNNRKLIDAIMQKANIVDDKQQLTILRAIDKLDRLGSQGVELLLGTGRKDDSGDFTPGAGLEKTQISSILHFVESATAQVDRTQVLRNLEKLVGDNEDGARGIAQLQRMHDFLEQAGFGQDKVKFDPSVVRGLEYYTSIVFEAELVGDDDNRPLNIGSIGGGGRYDGLIKRFKGIEVPATGFSFGVSRLAFALEQQEKRLTSGANKIVAVLVMDPDCRHQSYAIARSLREAGIRAEAYMGSSGMKAQMKFADKKGAAFAIIQGSDEREKGVVQIKDLQLGKSLSADVKSHDEWKTDRPAQFEVAQYEIVSVIKKYIFEDENDRKGESDRNMSLTDTDK